MADENNSGTPPAANPPATPADAGGARSEPLLNYKEVVELRKETRETRDLLKQLLEKSGRSEPAPAAPTTPAPKDTPPKGDEVATQVQALQSEMTTMRREGALKDAFLDHGITDPDIRDLLKTATANSSPADVAAMVAKYAGKLKPAAQPTTPAVPAIPVGTSNTGAAGGEARTQVPNDVLAVSKEAWAQLSPAEKRAHYEREKRAKGGDFNPFAESRARVKK